MSFQNYTSNNNCRSLLVGWISAWSTSMIITSGEWAIRPSTYPYLQTIESYTNSIVTKREIVKVTNRSSDTFTIVRSSWYCVQDDSVTPKVRDNTARAFSDGDYVSLYITAEQEKDVQDEIYNNDNTSNLVHKTWTETITWVKSFTWTVTSTIAITTNTQVVTKLYVDNATNSITSWFITWDWSNGDLVVASGTTNLTLWTVYNYSSISISAGATLSTAWADGTMKIKCKGTCTIDGTINLQWKGNDWNIWSGYLFGKLSAVNVWTNGTVWAWATGGHGGTSWTALWGTPGVAWSWYGWWWGWWWTQSLTYDWWKGWAWWTPWGVWWSSQTTGHIGIDWWTSAGWSGWSGWSVAGWSGKWWDAYGNDWADQTWAAARWWGWGGWWTIWVSLKWWNIILYASTFAWSGTINCNWSATNWGNGGKWGKWWDGNVGLAGWWGWWWGWGWGGWWGGWWWAILLVWWSNTFGWTTTVVKWSPWTGGTWWAIWTWWANGWPWAWWDWSVWANWSTWGTNGTNWNTSNVKIWDYIY